MHRNKVEEALHYKLSTKMISQEMRMGMNPVTRFKDLGRRRKEGRSRGKEDVVVVEEEGYVGGGMEGERRGEGGREKKKIYS